ncbi:ABC transporter ATP-binding protein [Shinella sp.]|uniref:ABC transporter ATP-binding protein n=1 Tax=Shinella sp. TaxID=1870904 RepID=UPI0039E4E751
MTPLLQVDRLKVRYGQLTAVHDVSLSVDPGEIVCIVGPNGAGKSTTLAAIAGGVAVVDGSVALGGVPIRGRRSVAIAAMGVSLVPEGRHVFATMSVVENLAIGASALRERRRLGPEIERVFEIFPQLRERAAQPAGKLSGGEQQMLVVGRALMTRPKIMLIDEPSLGLAPKIVDTVYDILLRLREAEGLTLLINEQSSERILKFADRLYVLREGRMQLSGRPAEFAGTDAVQSAYFGFDHQGGATREAHA